MSERKEPDKYTIFNLVMAGFYGGILVSALAGLFQ